MVFFAQFPFLARRDGKSRLVIHGSLSLPPSYIPSGKGWCVTSGVFSDDGISLSLSLYISPPATTPFLSAFEVNLYGGDKMLDPSPRNIFWKLLGTFKKIKIYTRSYATVHVAIIRDEDDSQIYLGRGTRQINTRAQKEAAVSAPGENGQGGRRGRAAD